MCFNTSVCTEQISSEGLGHHSMNDKSQYWSTCFINKRETLRGMFIEENQQ